MMMDENKIVKTWVGPSPIEILDHPDPLVRLTFVYGLGEDGHLGSLPLLMKALHDPEMAVRLTAAWALHEIAPDLVPNRYAVDALVREAALTF